MEFSQLIACGFILFGVLTIGVGVGLALFPTAIMAFYPYPYTFSPAFVSTVLPPVFAAIGGFEIFVGVWLLRRGDDW
jgi:hypothetical protein